VYAEFVPTYKYNDEEIRRMRLDRYFNRDEFEEFVIEPLRDGLFRRMPFKGPGAYAVNYMQPKFCTTLCDNEFTLGQGPCDSPVCSFAHSVDEVNDAHDKLWHWAERRPGRGGALILVYRAVMEQYRLDRIARGRGNPPPRVRRTDDPSNIPIIAKFREEIRNFEAINGPGSANVYIRVGPPPPRGKGIGKGGKPDNDEFGKGYNKGFGKGAKGFAGPYGGGDKGGNWADAAQAWQVAGKGPFGKPAPTFPPAPFNPGKGIAQPQQTTPRPRAESITSLSSASGASVAPATVASSVGTDNPTPPTAPAAAPVIPSVSLTVSAPAVALATDIAADTAVPGTPTAADPPVTATATEAETPEQEPAPQPPAAVDPGATANAEEEQAETAATGLRLVEA
jgi:hypothetical protein